jgi:heme exporter protein B
MKAFSAIFLRDLRLGLRQGGGAMSALSFMLAVLVMVPLALGPDQNLLQRLAPGFMWMTLLLAVLLTSERIFQQDFEDGTLDGLVGSGLPLELVVFAKALAHWLSISLPLALTAPFLGLLLNINVADIPLLLAAMALGSLALSMLTSIAGAVTAGLKRGGLLAALLVLPLDVPVLIFGLSVSASSVTPVNSSHSLMILGAITLISIAIQPLAAAAALRAYLH